ncbi:hypothetical protein E3N88_05473 [Mikania micrantha]|uniref:NADP-dependent oxidoreductase domain-containing protein n=1 Tax=Mikania micrantha TaxID=192012 RepID=A0A5N6PN80_9ASTR|nr:hypothetical protein E3N88_05473 [Mikania micrantha]
MARVPRIKLGSQGLEVSAQGLGCMGMSAFYGPPRPEPDMINLIHQAISAGVAFLDTSDFYGPKTNEILLGKVKRLQSADHICSRRAGLNVCSLDPSYSQTSKIENEEIVNRCKERKTVMKESVSARNAFAAAHFSCVAALKNTGAAISDYPQGEVEFSDHRHSSFVDASSSKTILPPAPPQPPYDTLFPPLPPLQRAPKSANDMVFQFI